jgi:RND family efflux transporter MFP subunit
MSKGLRSFSFYVVCTAAVVGAGYAVLRYYNGADQKISAMRSAQAKVAELGPRIEIVKSTKGPEFRTIKLLGDVRSAQTATIYGKVSGYLKSIKVDKGDMVQAGQVIGEIESPELEQQFAGASADLANKRRNLERLRGLFAKGSTTQVAMLQAETDALVAENNVGALATTKAYQILRAPFAGRITARFADPGALVTNAQTNFVSAMPLVTVSDDTRVRVYAYLQQQDVPFVKVGDKAEVVDASRPERKKSAEITRMTGELDPKSRTMLIEVHLDNRDGYFTPGSFAYLTLQVPVASFTQIPVTALLTRGNQSFVAALDNERITFRPITVASTDGATINIAEGVKPGETVAINVPDEVTNGSRIQPVSSTRLSASQ